MALGDGARDHELNDAWADFCNRLKAAGERVFKDENPANALQRADGFVFLTQNLSQVFDLALETRDTQYPALHAFCSPSRKLGADNADFIYLQAWIDGHSVYKISGNKGTARFMNFTVQGLRPALQPGTAVRSLHEPFGDIPEANLFGAQLKAEWDGSFVLYIGGPERGPNWLPTTPGSRKLFLRQGFDDWTERSAEFRIERIDMAAPRPRPTPDTILSAIDWAGEFVTGLMNDWPEQPLAADPALATTPVNEFPPLMLAGDGADVRRRGRVVCMMRWALAADEALVIEFDDYDGFWMFTNMGAFFSSMDFLYRSVSFTPSRAAVDSDGKVRLVMSHDDRGYHNWIDTQGFAAGILAYRNLMSDAAVDLRVKTVKAATLADHLPADTRKVTAAERIGQMYERFNAIRRRYRL